MTVNYRSDVKAATAARNDAGRLAQLCQQVHNDLTLLAAGKGAAGDPLRAEFQMTGR
jgi:hypothetical protein